MRQNRAHDNQQDRLRAPRRCVARQKDVWAARPDNIAQTIDREAPSSLLDPIYLDNLARRISGFLRKELPASQEDINRNPLASLACDSAKLDPCSHLVG